MSFAIRADGISCTCYVSDSDIRFSPEFGAVRIKTEDIIGCEVVSTSWFFNRPALNLWYIVQKDDNVLMREKIQITGEENVWRRLEKEIQDKLANLTKRPKSLLVLINPIGGKKRAVKEYQNTVSPIFSLADINCDVFGSRMQTPQIEMIGKVIGYSVFLLQVSNKPKKMVEIMRGYDTSGLDGIVVLGGDGSFAEVANVLIRNVQEQAGVDYNDPGAKVQPIKIPIAMIPTGSGNYVAAISTGCRDIVTSVLHVVRGHVSHVNVLGVYADGKLVDYGGVACSHGLTAELSYLSDVKYRWLGQLRYYAVPLRFLLLNAAFKTYNAEVTCYTDEKNVNEIVREENGTLFMNGQKVRYATLKDSTEKTVSFNGSFVGVFSICGNVINQEKKTLDWKNVNRKPHYAFSTLFTNSSITAYKLFQQLKEFINQEESLEDDFFDTVTVRGIKVRITDKDKYDGSDDDLIRHLIMVDGEIYKIKDTEFQFWFHENVVPVFSSFKG